MATESASGLEVTRYSTDDLPERDRFAVWREVVGPFVRLDFSPVPDHPFRARGTLCVLPGLAILWADNSGIRMERTRGLAADGSDDLFVPLVTSGRRFVFQRGRETTLDTRGTAVLSSDIGTITCTTRSQAIVLRFPRMAIASAAPRLEDTVGQSIPKNSGALRLLTHYVELLRADGMLASPALGLLAATHVHDLIALALGATRDAAELASGRGVRAARLRAVKADIVANLSSRDLSVGAVAKRQGISPRYVQMLFEREGTSFSQFALNQRLSLAHGMLTDPRQDHLTITAIAYAAGFGDLSHFNKSFRRRYDAAPGEVRTGFPFRPEDSV